ncbi:hypothetical protein EMCRGX_G028538 [Ephydatia muelleri]
MGFSFNFGADTLNGAATLDWFNSRTGVALEIPDLDLDIELHSAATKPFNSSGELYTYNDNELGVACLGVEGDWLTKPIILPCSQNEQRSDNLFTQPPFNLGFPEEADFSSPSPASVTSCYSFELNDADISTILDTVDSSCFQDLPVILPTLHPGTDDRDVMLPSGLNDQEADKPNVPASKDRKKEQNKSAALKYRQKKRELQTGLEDRRDKLEEQNKKLQSDAASLEKEIAYLKELWQELHGKLQT